MLAVFLAVAITVNSAVPPPPLQLTVNCFGVPTTGFSISKSSEPFEVVGYGPRWFCFTATASEARVTDGWLVLVGTEQQPVELRLPVRDRRYVVRRVELRLKDGEVRFPDGPATAYPLK